MPAFDVKTDTRVMCEEASLPVGERPTADMAPPVASVCPGDVGDRPRVCDFGMVGREFVRLPPPQPVPA